MEPRRNYETHSADMENAESLIAQRQKAPVITSDKYARRTRCASLAGHPATPRLGSNKQFAGLSQSPIIPDAPARKAAALARCVGREIPAAPLRERVAPLQKRVYKSERTLMTARQRAVCLKLRAARKMYSSLT